MEWSKIVDAHNITKPNEVMEEKPQSFEEAYNHQDEAHREKWRPAKKKAFHDMNKRGIWKN